jgi:hypothetical protein
MNPHAFFGLDRRGIHTGVGDTVEIDELRDLYWAEAVLRGREHATAQATPGVTSASSGGWSDSIRMAS